MSAILSQVFTLPVQIILAVTIIILILLYLLSIVWVNRDARQREMSTVLWTIIAIIPVAGLVAYCLMRPALMRADIEEQEMELELLSRQLDLFIDCPHCGYPTKPDYLVCPQCRKRLRAACVVCGRPLNHEWTVCPYCANPVQRGGSSRSGRRQQHAAKHAQRSSHGHQLSAGAEDGPAEDSLKGKDPFDPRD